MRASSVLCSCRRRAARFGDRSARILLTAIIPATPLSSGWFDRCAPACSRNRPRPPRAQSRPVHGTAHTAPADRVDSGRTRCDALSSGARPPRSQALPGNAMPVGSACIPSNALPGAGGGASPAVRSQAPPGNEGGPRVSPSAVFVLSTAGGGRRVKRTDPTGTQSVPRGTDRGAGMDVTAPSRSPRRHCSPLFCLVLSRRHRVW